MVIKQSAWKEIPVKKNRYLWKHVDILNFSLLVMFLPFLRSGSSIAAIFRPWIFDVSFIVYAIKVFMNALIEAKIANSPLIVTQSILHLNKFLTSISVDWSLYAIKSIHLKLIFLKYIQGTPSVWWSEKWQGLTTFTLVFSPKKIFAKAIWS